MKIIILAAGKGTRLYPLTKNTPKPLIDMGDGVTLLEHQLQNIQESKVIDKIILIIGYLEDQIEAKIKLYKKNGLELKTIYNPFYEMSNNLISLWLSNHEMGDEDFIITNGDNLFTPEVFSDLVKNTGDGIILTITKQSEYHEDDMKVILDNNNVIKVSKNIDVNKASAVSVGLVKVQGERYRKVYRNILEKLARNKEYLNKFWLETFNDLSSNGVAINTFEIDGETQWTEVDFKLDLKTAKDFISSIGFKE